MLDPMKIHKTEDLNEPETLARALRLLYRARFGIPAEQARISPHVTYDKLFKNIENAIMKSIEIKANMDIVRFLCPYSWTDLGVRLYLVTNNQSSTAKHKNKNNDEKRTRAPMTEVSWQVYRRIREVLKSSNVVATSRKRDAPQLYAEQAL
ncbi:hypothetical protein MMC17_001015 [Xylographa soralifera]|nr:hypothetical protein [Xylographa soralifera]